MEGTIAEVSNLPDPKKSDYPNCRFIVRLVGHAILKGISSPKEVALVVEGFKDYKILPESNLKLGDKVSVVMMPFEDLPEEKKSTQVADDLNLFTLEQYYCINITKLTDFKIKDELSESNSHFTDNKIEHISVFSRHVNPPISNEYVKAQKDAIASDLAKINAMLEPYTNEKKKELNTAFNLAWEKEKAKDKDGYNRVKQNNTTYVWRNINNSFWCLPEKYTFTYIPYSVLTQKKLDALLALQHFLEANGCQFILSLVPHYHDIAARVINKDFSNIPAFRTAMVAKQLLEAGIETTYVSGELIKNYNRFPWSFFYPHDAHPSYNTQDVISDLLTEKLTRYHIEKTLDEEKFATEFRSHIFTDREGYAYPNNCDIGENQPNTYYKCPFFTWDKQSVVNHAKMNSQILILGNSFIQRPYNYALSSLIAKKMQVSVSDLEIWGQGPTTEMIKRLFLNPEKHLWNKKVVVMQMGVTHVVGFEYNNIQEMDMQRSLLNGKKCIKLIPVKSEYQSEIYTTPDVNVVKLDDSGHFSMVYHSNDIWDSKQPVVVGVNCWKLISQKLKMSVNQQNLNIMPYQDNVGKYHLSLINLPAGTDTITFEISGTAGHEIAIKDIQFFQ